MKMPAAVGLPFDEYGRTTAYGSQTADTGAGSGTAGVDVSAPIAGLSPNTSYHFRIVARNAIGTRSGADKTFTTAAVHPPAVSTGAATAVTTTTATLKGTVNPQGQSTTYYFQWGLTAAYGVNGKPRSAGAGTSPVAVQEGAGGLIPGTVYHYRVLATNAVGTSLGKDRTFRTARFGRLVSAATASPTG